ncbi:MAG TPA: hypothetical protein VFO00_13480 [Vitreimonas sp.]|nr:hypothetical protein [Vitreimonas sp.]
MRLLITAAAAAFALGLAACSQGTQEEAGEQADTAAEQATTGETDLGQGPMEEAGEAADEAADGTDPAPGDSTAPATTP